MRKFVAFLLSVLICTTVAFSSVSAQGRQMASGQTFPIVITTAAPAAGAESVTTVPAGQFWRVLSWYAVLTPDATVASRNMSLSIDDGTNVLAVMGNSSFSAAASQVVKYTYISGLGVTLSDTGSVPKTYVLPFLSELAVLPPGSRISTVTNNKQAGDQWSAAKLLVQRVY